MSKHNLTKENTTTILVSLLFLFHAIVKSVFCIVQNQSGVLGIVTAIINGITLALCSLIAFWTLTSSPKQITPLTLIRYHIPIMFITNNLRIMLYGGANFETILANLVVCIIVELWATERINWIRLAGKILGGKDGE